MQFGKSVKCLWIICLNYPVILDGFLTWIVLFFFCGNVQSDSAIREGKPVPLPPRFCAAFCLCSLCVPTACHWCIFQGSVEESGGGPVLQRQWNVRSHSHNWGQPSSLGISVWVFIPAAYWNLACGIRKRYIFISVLKITAFLSFFSQILPWGLSILQVMKIIGGKVYIINWAAEDKRTKIISLPQEFCGVG